MGKTHMYYEFIPDEVIDSNLFWLIEYIKRNPNRKESFALHSAEFQAERDIKVRETNFGMSVCFDDNNLPTFPPDSMKNAESIVREMKSGTFVPKCDPYCFDSDFSSPVEMIIEDGKPPRFEFDIDGDSTTISNHVQLILDYYRGVRKPVAKGSCTLLSLDDVELEQREDRYIIRSLPTIKADLRLELKARQAGDPARAVGLWLWDYVQGHGGKDNCGVATSIRAMKEQLGPEIKALGFADTEQNVFRRFYRKTAECIYACEVLPFK